MTASGRLTLLALLLLASAAGAWPVDLRVPVPHGTESFRRVAAVEWIEVEDPKVAQAEILPSGELMFTGVTPGKTLLLLYAEGRFAVWRLEVTKDGQPMQATLAPAALAAAKRACPDLALQEKEERKLTATVQNDACRRALMALLEADAVLANELELTFTLEALQAQLGAIEKVLGEKKLVLSARYLGAGLVLEGPLPDEAARRAALWTAFRQSLGRVPLEDRMKVPPAPAADAGR